MKSALITVSLELAAGAAVRFAEHPEVSRDCPVCRRLMRTVMVRRDGMACCLPTGHSLEARVRTVESGQDWVSYRIDYAYQAFLDENWDLPAKPLPAWARVYFHVVCSRCETSFGLGVQSNQQSPWERNLPIWGASLSGRSHQPLIEALSF